jgi:hypothetical protein
MRWTSIGIAALAACLGGCGGAASPEPAREAGSVTPPPTGAPALPATPTAPAEARDYNAGLRPTEDVGILRAREHTARFYRGELDGLFGEFSDEMKEVFPMDRLTALRDFVRQQYGEETGVVAEQAHVEGPYRYVARWCRFAKHEKPIEIQWILREERIAGLFIKPVESQDATE